RDAAVEHGFPGAVVLPFPDRKILAEGDRVIFRAVWPVLPWSSGIAEIARARHIGKSRLPAEQAPGRLPFSPKLLAVDRSGLENDAIIRQKFQKGVTRSFGRGRSRKRVLHFDQRVTIYRPFTLFLRKPNVGREQDYADQHQSCGHNLDLSDLKRPV